MRLPAIVKVVIFGAIIPVFCSGTERDDDPRRDLNAGSKRSRRNNESDESSLISGVQSMTLSVPDFIGNDPVLKFCYENIPTMSDRELAGIFDEAVFNENLGMIKIFIMHGKLGTLVESDHIEALCRSRSEASDEILDLLLDATPFSEEIIGEMNLAACLTFCVPHGLEKFKSFLKAFKDESLSLPVKLLADVLSHVASFETREFYDVLLNEINFDHEVVKEAVLSATLQGNVNVIKFLLENGMSFSFLDKDQKIKIALMATRTNNPFLLTYLLRDREVLLGVSVIPKSPWIIAINRDHPEVLDVFINLIPSIQEGGLAMLAFSQQKHKVMDYFKMKGVLTDQLLFRMALTSIQSLNLELLKFLKHYGIPFSMVDDLNGFNLLTTAVSRDLYEYVEYLIKDCHMDANARSVNYDIDNTRTTFTPIYFAKSPKMVQILVENGANVNEKYERVTHHGVVVRSTTALHKAAAESNMAMFAALIDLGADIKIADAVGLTNEAFYYRNFFNYPENF